MRQRTLTFSAILLLTLSINTAWAGIITYRFDTVLELERGADTANLNGATMTFIAEIADGTRYEPDPIFGWESFTLASYQWSISGGSNVDGIYNGTTTGNWSLLVWGGGPASYFPVAPFTTLAIYQQAPSASNGNLVNPADFDPLMPAPAPPDLAAWEIWTTTDGSQYNWNRNGRFAFSEVPLPSTLVLLIAGFGAALLQRKLIHFTQ